MSALTGASSSDPNGETDLPFNVVLTRLKQERKLSFRELHLATKQVDPAEDGLSFGHLSRLSAGLDRPSPAAIALIARALELPARYFAEYRLAEARALFDERGPDGLDGALQNLRRAQHVLGAAPQVQGERRRSRRQAA
jgi:transcriptional regulator with XRE-family HTH domain